jgi:hypothetical protein
MTYEDWLDSLPNDEDVMVFDAWQAGYEAGRNAPLVKTYTGGVPNYCTPSQEPVIEMKRHLVKIHNALCMKLGDTDPHFPEDFSDEEIREENPVYWAAKEIAGLIGDAPWDKYTAAPSQEPVAWMRKTLGAYEEWFVGTDEDHDGCVPLYTTPPDAVAQIADQKRLNEICLADNERLTRFMRQAEQQIAKQRRVMQLALDELVTQRDAHYNSDFPIELRDAITALREALNCGCSGDCNQGRECDCK